MSTISPERRKASVLWRVLRHIALLPVYAYRYLISPLLPKRCRYYPSCSVYTTDAIKTLGIVKGTVVSAMRILRCNALFGCGVDHVPEGAKPIAEARNAWKMFRAEGRELL